MCGLILVGGKKKRGKAVLWLPPWLQLLLLDPPALLFVVTNIRREVYNGRSQHKIRQLLVIRRLQTVQMLQ